METVATDIPTERRIAPNARDANWNLLAEFFDVIPVHAMRPYSNLCLFVERSAKLGEHHRFLQKCEQADVVPRELRPKTKPYRGIAIPDEAQWKAVLHRASMTLMRLLMRYIEDKGQMLASSRFAEEAALLRSKMAEEGGRVNVPSADEVADGIWSKAKEWQQRLRESYDAELAQAIGEYRRDKLEPDFYDDEKPSPGNEGPPVGGEVADGAAARYQAREE